MFLFSKFARDLETQSVARLFRRRKNRQGCHPEEPQATKDLCIA
jgi:hypothetical protein